MAAKVAQLQRGGCHAENLFFYYTTLPADDKEREREREIQCGSGRERCTLHAHFRAGQKSFWPLFSCKWPTPNSFILSRLVLLVAAAARLSSSRGLCLDNFKLQVQLFRHHIGKSCRQLADIECQWGRLEHYVMVRIMRVIGNAISYPSLPISFSLWSNEPNELCKMSNGCHPLSHAGQVPFLCQIMLTKVSQTIFRNFRSIYNSISESFSGFMHNIYSATEL